MRICIPKETLPGERRVMATPKTVARLTQAGWEVAVEKGAGMAAGHIDEAYLAAGALLADPDELWKSADVVAKVRPPAIRPDGTCECDGMREGAILISFLHPDQNAEIVERLAARKASALALDRIPRISRAQKVDALSAMANIAGYRSVIEAANCFGRFFTGQMTAAGKVPPAQVLVIGAGVAGLAAIAAAKGLGGVVRAFDVRPAVGEQIRSLGAEFLTVEMGESGEGQGGYAREMSKEFIDAEMALFRKQAPETDIVITTALIPGRPAPKLWLKDMVGLMRPGSVVVDLAAENGGNCELTVPGQAVVQGGVTLIGYTDMPSRMSGVSSDLLGGILYHLLDEMGGASRLAIDPDNDIVRGALVLSRGIRSLPPPAKPQAPKAEAPAKSPVSKAENAAKAARPPEPSPTPSKAHGAHGSHAPQAPSRTSGMVMAVLGLLAAATWLYLRYSGAPDAAVSEGTRSFIGHLTVFVMAVFVGWQIIWNVTPALHTPLMSVTNATSGIIVVGGIIGARGNLAAASITALVATLFATINIVGGFMVTRRMLAMFRK